MPGPPPKPARQKKLEGTHRKDREAPNALDFDPATDLPAPPEDLRSEAACRCWEVCAKELHGKGMLAVVDLALLRAYCYQVGLMLEAENELELNGKTETRYTANGSHQVRSPWVAILSDATEKVHKIGQQFGFSPASRTRISAPKTEKPKADPWADL
ncbi:phage terminase small subunit P27 family [Microvirga sp. STS02]|uniref:phage terminase small subunit P27 family n=1 Tax=Hymenobacter negativus TaxID=2795026 RepID=UPI0018DBADC0|nr:MULTISPECIES: phage terminase small subunit P27 family [Bacteria]MBH8569369.1 phage terminase small subunit P27 family [Hymenobacter negativus]MBR7209103.1 phage terminase small subunit P27 family [Microvirga sp. STS02]